MKLALIYSSSDSYWYSCRLIQANILKCLSLLPEKIVFQHFDTKELEDEGELVMKMIEIEVDQYFFLSHYPHPLELIKHLKKINSKNISITFLIYGGFISSLASWYETFDLLKNDFVRIICASQAQERLVRKFIVGSVHVIPFPVDEKIFYQVARSKNTHEKIKLIYAGRLSYEKNIHHLILFLFKALDEGFFPFGFELSLAGYFDQLHRPLLGDDGVFGSYYFYLFDEIANTVGKERFDESIKLLGPRNQKQLKNDFAASDIFVSLSTFSSEDYGMAAAEALETGLPVILSGWGGHYGFKTIYQNRVNLVECDLQVERVVPNYHSFKMALVKSLSNLQLNEPSGKLSIDEISLKYEKLFASHFEEKLILKDFEFENMFVAEKGNDRFKDVYETYLDE
jgi:glycosyltransferase involved in cell wall biosynthesis